MKQKLLKTLALGLMAMTGMTAWADDVEETLTATQDGWYRLDNSSVTYDIASESHIELKRYTDGSTVKDMYGMLSFSIPAKDGYVVKSASLRFVSKMIKANRTTNFYKLGTDITAKPSFSDLSSSVTAALATEAIGTVSAEGNSGKQITDNDISDKYQVLSAWVNNIAIAKSAVIAGEKLNLLIAIPTDAASSSNTNRFFGKNAAEFTNSNYATLTATSGDIVPQLTVVYEEDLDTKTVTNTPTADTFLRKGNSDNNGSKTYIEVVNSSTTDFVGLMSFNVPQELGMEIQSATLRLVTKRVKSSRATVSLYTYTGEWAESAKYADQESNVTDARTTSAIASFSPEGQLNKDVSSDEITESKYQTIDGWQNTVDLTAYVKDKQGTTFSIMIDADADKGQLQFFSKEATAFTNSNTEITNTNDDLVPQLTIVFKKMDSYKLTVNAYKAATLVLPFNAIIPSGVTAYTLNYTEGNNAVNATEVTGGTLEANTPVLVNAEAGDYTFTRTGNIISASAVSGALTGVYTTTNVPSGSYILWANATNPIGFYQSNSSTVAPYRAYLTADGAGASMLTIDFDNENTGISEMESTKKAENGVFYNLSGQRVQNVTKGLYIVNGKKYVIK